MSASEKGVTNMTENTEILAAGLFEAGNQLGLAVLGFLALAALVIGAGSAIRKLKEGSGAAITAEILPIP